MTTDTLSNYELWSALAALGVPFAVALINQERWSPLVKWISFAVVALATAFVTTWLAGQLDAHDLTRSILIVLTAATAAFHAFRPAVKQVERGTSAP